VSYGFVSRLRGLDFQHFLNMERACLLWPSSPSVGRHCCPPLCAQSVRNEHIMRGLCLSASPMLVCLNTESTSTTNYFPEERTTEGRSQWPCSLTHELSSPARALGSWVRIPLEAWMSVCVYRVIVLSCVQVAALRRTDPPSKESYQLCKKIKRLRKRPRPNKGLWSHRQTHNGRSVSRDVQVRNDPL
jgi:hypothetical protein